MCRHFVFLSLLLTQSLVLVAQTPEPPLEAKRYHDLLRRRPQAGTMFDRFHDAWLEAASAESLMEFLKVQAARPESQAADHRLLALLYARRGQDSEALTSLDAALKLSPQDAAAWFEKARLQGRSLDFEGSLKSLERASDSNPSDLLRIEIARQQGRALLRLDRTPEALQIWLNLAKQHPDDLDLTEDVVELMAEEGLYAEAAAEAKTLVEKTKNASEKLTRQLRLGDLLLRAEKRDEALTVLETSLAQSGQNSWVEADVLTRLDQVFRREDDLEGLKTRLETLSKAHPQRVQLGIGYASVLAELGDPEAAVTLFRELLSRNPGRRDLQEDYIALLERMERLTEASHQAQILVTQHPEDKELLIRLATLQQRQKDTTTAQATLETYLKKSTANGIAPENDHLRIARLLEAWEVKEAAKRSYETLVKDHPQSISAKEALAHYFHRAKEDAAALEIWRELVKSSSIEDVLRVGQALLSHNLTKEAQEILSTRLKDFPTQPRFLALLAQLALNNKDYDHAVTWSRARLANLNEVVNLQDAVKQAHQAIRDGQVATQVISEIQTEGVALTISDRCLLAELLEEANQPEAAETALQAPQATMEQQLMLGSQRIRLLEQRQEWARAAEVLKQLMQMPGGQTSDHARQLVRLHRRTLNYEEALTAILEWKKLSPGAVQPLLEEYNILMEQAKQSAALDVLRSASRKFSEDREVMSTLANALAMAGKTEEARAAYLNLYEQTEDPSSRLRFLPPLAQMAQSTGTLPQLLEDFQQRQRQNRASALPWLALAGIHAATNNDEERRRCLYEASRLRPKDLALLTEISRIEEESGLIEEALRTLNAAASLDTSNATKQKIASLMIESGDEEAGFQLMFELAGVATAHARAIEKMADTLVASGQWSRAISLLAPLLPRFPDDYRLHYLYAVALEEEGLQNEAVLAYIHLLGMHEELPEILAAKQLSTNQPNSYSGEIAELPEGTAEWMQLPRVAYTAYQHRQKQRGYPSHHWQPGYQLSNPGGVSALTGGWVQQPTNVTNLSAMALYHLVELGQGMSTDDKAALVSRMDSAGIRDAALLLEVPMYEGMIGIPPDVLEAHPDHAALHALWLIHIHQMQGDVLPGLKRCLALFKDRYPQLAFQAGLVAFALDEPEASPVVNEALELAERLPEGPIHFLSPLLNSLMNRRLVIRDDPASSEVLDRMLTLAIKWSTQISQADQANWSAHSLILTLGLMNRWETLAELLEIENARQLKLKTNAPNPNPFGGGYFQPRPLQLIWSGLDVSPGSVGIIQQLSRGQNYGYGGDPEPPEDAPDTLKGLQSVLAHLTTKSLQIVMHQRLGDHEAAKSLLEEWLKQSELKADHWLFAAYSAQMRQDWSQVISYLHEATLLQPAASIQRIVDDSILFAALTLGQDLSNEARIIVTESFERIRTSLLGNQQRDALIEYAMVLGLDEQVKTLKQVSVVKASPRSRPSVNPYSRNYRSSQQSAFNTLERLLSKGNSDAAFTEFKREVKTIGEMWLGQSWGNATSQAQNLRKILDQRQVTARFMDQLKALPQTSWKQQQEQAAFFELLGNHEAAKGAYQVAIEMQPRAWEAHARLASLMAREDPEQALAHLSLIPPVELRQILQRLSNDMSQRSREARSFDDRLALIRLLAAYVEKSLDIKRRIDPSLANILSQMPQQIQQGEYEPIRFPGLYEASQSGNPIPEEGKKARAQLRAAFDDYCLALMKIPMLAMSGFGPYAGLALKNDESVEKLEPIALEVLGTQAMARRYAPNLGNWYGRSNNRFSGSRGGNQISLPQPEDILLRLYLQRDEMEKIESELLPLVQRASGNTAEKQMRAYTQLFTCAESDFLQVARDWMRSQNTSPEPNSGHEIARIWSQRGLSTPIHDIFLERLRNPNLGVQSAEIQGYILTLNQGGHSSQAYQFLHQVRDLWLGPNEDQRQKALDDFLKQQNSRSRNYSWGGYGFRGPRPQVQSYLSLLNEIGHDGSCTLGLRVAREDGLLNEPWIFEQLSSPLSNTSILTGPPAQLLDVLDELQILAAAQKFRAWFYRPEQQNTFLNRLLNGLNNTSQKKSTDLFTEALAARQPTTFGADLILSLLPSNEKERGEGLQAFLKRRAKEIPRLSDAARSELSAFLRERVRNYPAHLDAESAPLIEPLIEAERAQSEKTADKILAAKAWEETAIADHAASQVLPDILQDIAVKNRAKAAQLLEHSIALLKRTPSQIQANPPGSGPVYALISQMGRVPSLMNEVLALAAHEELNSDWLSRFGYSMEHNDSLSDPAHILALFTDTPFVAEAEKFRCFEMPNRSEGSILARLTNNLRHNSNYKQAMESLQTDLKARQPQTFGVKLTLTLLSNSSDEMDRFIRDHQADFSKVQSTEAQYLLNTFIQRNAKFQNVDRLPEDLQDALSPLLKTQKGDDDQWRQSLMDAPTLAAVGYNSNDYEKLASLLRRTIRRDRQIGLAFFDKLTLLFATEHRIQQGSIHPANGLLGTWLHQCAGIPELFTAMLKRAENEDMLSQRDWARSVIGYVNDRGQMQEIQPVLALLKDSPFLADIEDFRAYAIEDDSQGSIMAYTVNAIRRSKPTAAALLAHLREQPSTFGSDLFMVLLQESPKPALVDFLKKRSEEIDRLSSTSRAEFTVMIEPLLSPLVSYARDVPLLKPLLEAQRQKAEDAKNTLLAISDYQTLNQSQRDQEHHARTLALIVQHDPQGAREVFAHLVKLMDAQDSASSSTVNDPAYSNLARHLASLKIDPGLWPIMAKEAQGRGLTRNKTWMQMADCGNYFQNRETDAPLVIDAFTRAGLFSEAADFDPLPGLGGVEHSSLLHYFSHRLPNLNIRHPVMKHLDSQKHKTFGMALIGTFFKYNRDNALNEFATSHATAFKDLPLKTQAAVLTSIESHWPSLNTPKQLPEDVKTALSSILDSRREQQIRFADNVIQGTDFHSLELTEPAYVETCKKLLLKLLADGDETKAALFFDKAVQLMEEKQKSTGWDQYRSGGGGWTLRSHFLLDSMKATSPDTLAFGLKLLNEDKTGRLVHTGSYQDYNWGLFLFQRWQHHGGRADPRYGMENMLQELQEAVKEQPVSLLALAFHHLVLRMQTSDVRLLSEWAGALPKSHPCHALAREFFVASKVYLESHPDGVGPDGKCLIQNTPSQKALWQHYKKAITSTDLSPQVRIALGHHLCQTYPWAVPADLLMPLTRLLADENLKLHAVRSNALAAVVRCSGGLPLTDEWRATSQKLWEGWLKRQSFHNQNSNRGQWYGVGFEPVFAMLQLAGRMKQDEWIHTLFEQASYLKQNRSIVSVLVYAGYPEKAAELLQAHHASMTSWQSAIYPWHPDMRTHLPAFLAACKDPGVALLGELIVLQASDPPSPVARGLKIQDPLDGRIGQLAPKVMTTSFTSESLRRHAASMVANYAPAAAFDSLSDFCTQSTAAITTAQLAEINDGGERALFEFLRAIHITREVVEGRTEPWLKSFEQLSRNSFATQNTLNDLAKFSTEVLSDLWKRGEARNVQIWLPVFNQMISSSEHRVSRHTGLAASFAYVLATQTPGGLTAWKKSLTGMQLSTCESGLRSSNRIFETAAAFVGKPGSKSRLPDQQRVALVLDLLKDEQLSLSFELISNLIHKHQLLTLDEALTHAATIHESGTKNWGRLYQIIECAVDQDRMKDALPLFDLVLEKPTLPARSLNDFSLRKAEFMLRLGDREKAAQILAALRNSKPSAELLIAVDILQRLLDQKK